MFVVLDILKKKIILNFENWRGYDYCNVENICICLFKGFEVYIFKFCLYFLYISIFNI